MFDSIRLFKAFTLLATILSISACSCSYDRAPSDIVAPDVKSVSPSESRSNVVTNTIVSVTFDEEMQEASINNGTFVLTSPSGASITGAISFFGISATLKPNQELEKETEYTVDLTRYIKDLAGNKLIRERKWKFTTGTEKDTSYPTVQEVVPAPGNTDVPLSQHVSVRFNETINFNAINSSNFYLQDNRGEPVSGTVQASGFHATFVPDESLNPNTLYTVVLTTAVQDQAGNALREEFHSQFTTIASEDTSIPVVTAISPANNEKDVAGNASIIASISEEVSSSSVNDQTVILTNDQGQSIPGTIITKNANIIFTPTSVLPFNTQFTMTLTTGITDLFDNPLAADFQWTFNTGSSQDTDGPTVSYINPEIDETNVANNNAISVSFSEPINPSSLSSAAFFVTDGGREVEGKITYSGNTAIFRPSAPLAEITQFTVRISADVADLAGNTMGSDFTWRFTTGIEPDLDIPTLSSVYPLNESTDVATNGAVLVTFSEAMDPSTLTPDSFIITDSSENKIVGTLKTIGASTTFQPLNALPFDTTFTATITNAAADLAGNALKEAYSWTFTTASSIDTTPPAIISTFPAGSTSNAFANRGVIVKFSELIAADSITSSSFYLTSGSNVVSSTITYSGDTIKLNPNSDLDFATTYVATLANSIRDLSGNKLETDFIWTFKTTSKQDIDKPEVLNIIPSENKLTTVFSPITIFFSEIMDNGSLNSASIKLLDTNGNEVAGFITANLDNVKITPATQLAYDSNYQVIITTDVRDLAHNHMAEQTTSSFNTSLPPDQAPPFPVFFTPLDGENAIDVTATISADFSESLDCGSLTTSTFTLSSSTGSIPGSVSCLDNVASFTPTLPLQSNTTFTATLTTGIQDLSAQTMLTDASWSFTTAPWTKQIGTLASDQSYSIGIDSLNQVIIAGITTGDLGSTNAGSTDIFISKYSDRSIQRWIKQIGSSADDYVSDLIVDSNNNIYITGYTYGDLGGTNAGGADLFATKLDSEGSVLWTKQFGTVDDDTGTGISIDSNGDIVISAYSFNGFDVHASNGGHDVVALKLNSDGAQIWSQQIGSIENDITTDIAIDSSDNVYITGYTLGDLSGSGNTGSADIFVSKFDSAGTLLFTKQTGSVLDDMAQSLAINQSDNSIYLAGFSFDGLNGNTHSGNADQVILKFDNSGTLVWTQQFGSDVDDRAYGIHVDSNQNIMVSGYTFGTVEGDNSGGYDITLSQFDTTGNRVWLNQFGSTEDDFGFATISDSNNNIYTTGFTSGVLDENVSSGAQDAFIVRHDTDGVKQ